MGVDGDRRSRSEAFSEPAEASLRRYPAAGARCARRSVYPPHMLPVLVALVGLVALALLVALVRRAGALGWVALVGLFVVCAVTNPDKPKHVSAIKEKAISQARAAKGIGAAIVGNALGDWADAMIGPLLEYNSYLLFSTTSVPEKTLSIGVLGQVFAVELKRPGQASARP